MEEIKISIPEQVMIIEDEKRSLLPFVLTCQEDAKFYKTSSDIKSSLVSWSYFPINECDVSFKNKLYNCTNQ